MLCTRSSAAAEHPCVVYNKLRERLVLPEWHRLIRIVESESSWLNLIELTSPACMRHDSMQSLCFVPEIMSNGDSAHLHSVVFARRLHQERSPFIWALPFGILGLNMMGLIDDVHATYSGCALSLQCLTRFRAPVNKINCVFGPWFDATIKRARIAKTIEFTQCRNFLYKMQTGRPYYPRRH